MSKHHLIMVYVKTHILISDMIPSYFIRYCLAVSGVNLLRVLESLSIIFPINKFLICDSWGVDRMKKTTKEKRIIKNEN